MLLLLIYWSYLGVSFLNLGFGFRKLTGLKSGDPILTIIFGMFAATILASSWAIFGRINIEFQLFLIALQFLIFIIFKSELITVYQDFGREFNTLSQRLKIVFGLVFSLTLLHAVSESFFIDNETYYIQTIKWLNQYGFVKGLANLHIFFGQTSGWHILQSAFSFSYVSNHWHELNAFCLLLGNLFSVFQLEQYSKNGDRLHLWSGLLPVGNLVLFAFSKVPAPSLGVAIISLVAFHYFVKQWREKDRESFNVLFLLCVFIVYIKITALPILLLPLLFLGKNFKNTKATLSWALGALVLGLFITKNVILTGYPLFPSTLFKSFTAVDYSLPASFYEFSFNRAKCYDFFISQEDYSYSNAMQIFLKWLFQAKTNSFYNGLMLLMMVLSPYYIKRFFNQKSYWLLYLVMVFQFLFIWYASPQYRFMIPFFLLFGLLVLSVFIKSKKAIYTTIYGSFALAFLLLIFPPKPGQHQQKLHFNQQQFTWERLLYPNENSNLKTIYRQEQIGNLTYFSPDSTVYIWANGDGGLPCVNAKQIDYFDKKLHYIPQLRTAEIRDGFYSKKTVKP